MNYGYVRVSSKDQNPMRQICALRKFGIDERNIFVDKKSGKDFNRIDYKRMIKKVRAGDLIAIESIDRLGRNYEEIQNQWRDITRKKKANIVVLDMPLLDTRNKSDDLTGTFIAEMVLQILSYVAQTERENTKHRQDEGIAAALETGVKFGRRPRKKPENFHLMCEKYMKKECTSREAAKACNIAQSTFLYWLKKEKENGQQE